MPQHGTKMGKATYHITTRTAQRKRWLMKNGFRDLAEEIITTFAEIYCVEIHSLVLMGNHYHILLTLENLDLDETELQRRFELLQAQNYRKQKWKDWMVERFHERITSLSWFMWEINRRIALRLNKINKSKGHFWGGRYKPILVEDDDSFTREMTYLEQNPCKAGLAEKPSDYRWCTAGRLKRELDKGKTPEMPAFGFLKYYAGEARTKAWIEAQDRLALYRGAVKKAVRKQQSIETVPRPQIKGIDIEHWLQSGTGNVPRDAATEFG